MSNTKEVENLFEKIVEEYGRLDVAVNNASIGGWSSNLEDTPDNILHSQYDPIANNVYGVFNLMKEEIKLFKKYNIKGAIVNLSSVNGITSCPGCSLYSASKYAIIGLTKSAALENVKSEPYIRINAIAPGLVDTYLTRNQATSYIDPTKQTWEMQCVSRDSDLWKKYKGEFDKMTTNGKLMEPEDIANLAVYLVSNKSSGITGTVISNDMGEVAKP